MSRALAPGRAEIRTVDIAFIALFAAILALLGLFPPIEVGVLTVPITLQTGGVMLAGSVLGARRGLLAVALFLLLVAMGAPLLSGGRGGLGSFGTPSGGYLLGWMAGAFVTGVIAGRRRPGRSEVPRLAIANAIGGIGVVYAIGIPFSAAVAGVSLWSAFTGAGAFVPGDVVKVIVATVVADRIRALAIVDV